MFETRKQVPVTGKTQINTFDFEMASREMLNIFTCNCFDF